MLGYKIGSIFNTLQPPLPGSSSASMISYALKLKKLSGPRCPRRLGQLFCQPEAHSRQASICSVCTSQLGCLMHSLSSRSCCCRADTSQLFHLESRSFFLVHKKELAWILPCSPLVLHIQQIRQDVICLTVLCR